MTDKEKEELRDIFIKYDLKPEQCIEIGKWVSEHKKKWQEEGYSEGYDEAIENYNDR
jgi:hypothetical protein